MLSWRGEVVDSFTRINNMGYVYLLFFHIFRRFSLIGPCTRKIEMTSGMHARIRMGCY